MIDSTTEYITSILRLVVDEQTNKDLANYRENVPSLNDAPEPNYTLSDFKYIVSNYNDRLDTLVFAMYIPYGHLTFRLDLELGAETFRDQLSNEEYEELIHYDFNELLDDPWTEGEWESKMQEIAARSEESHA